MLVYTFQLIALLHDGGVICNFEGAEWPDNTEE
jgi:hypothetical protein